MLFDPHSRRPKADSDAIQHAYAERAQKFHPNNAVTGDEEAFDAVNLAYEVLSDPARRHAFDNLKGMAESAVDDPLAAAGSVASGQGVPAGE